MVVTILVKTTLVVVYVVVTVFPGYVMVSVTGHTVVCHDC